MVLDEPTSGLDPLMEQVFQAVIRERCSQGATVLLSSHILSEVEALADRVSIIRRGQDGDLRNARGPAPTHPHQRPRRDRPPSSRSKRSPGWKAWRTGQVDGTIETRLHRRS